MLGEGLAMIALKRLDDAERDGDQIYAVIRGMGHRRMAGPRASTRPVRPARPKPFAALMRPPVTARKPLGSSRHTAQEPKPVMLPSFRHSEKFSTNPVARTGNGAPWDPSNRRSATPRPRGCRRTVQGGDGAAPQSAAADDQVDQPNPALEIEKSPFYLSTDARPWIADEGVPAAGIGQLVSVSAAPISM